MKLNEDSKSVLRSYSRGPQSKSEWSDFELYRLLHKTTGTSSEGSSSPPTTSRVRAAEILGRNSSSVIFPGA